MERCSVLSAILQTNKWTFQKWVDLFYNEVVHRPEELQNFCLYEISMWVKRIQMTKNHINEMKNQQEENDYKNYDSIDKIEDGTIFHHQEEHPGHEIDCLKTF